MEIKENYVTAALDFSRVHAGNSNIVISTELKKIISLGREIDLLESIRRQDNPNNDFFSITKKEIELYATYIGIDPDFLDMIILKKFENKNLIEFKDDNNIEIKFKDSKKIYEYAKSEIEMFDSKERGLLKLIAKGMIKPVSDTSFNNVISNFPSNFQPTIISYLNQTRILSPIELEDTILYSSPKIYKNKSLFTKLIKKTDETSVSSALEYLNQNPGIPIESIDKTYNTTLLEGLNVAGAIDSINLNVGGVSRSYIMPANLSSDRYDDDNLDQVKKTLANFRFGQRYSKWKLYSLQRFLESLLDRGFAGPASPIGTDYKNLELAGIVKVLPVSGDRYRFWMLKEDVIEDTLNVLRGVVPLITKDPNISINKMDNSVLSRMISSQKAPKEVEEVVNALREIQRSMWG